MKITLKSTVMHDGKQFKGGASCDFDNDTAEALIAAGVADPVTRKKVDALNDKQSDLDGGAGTNGAT